MSSFIVHFMMATFISSMGILLILLAKRVLSRHISARWQYNLGLLYFVLLVVPFIPSSFFTSFNTASWINPLRHEGNAISFTSYGGGTVHMYENGWLQDFAISVDHYASGYFPAIVFGIWVAGIITFALIIFLYNRKIHLIKESAKFVEDTEIISLFDHCKAEIGVKSNISLGYSVLVESPMTMGFFKPIIVLPMAKISPTDTRYALMHELEHCKRRDIQINSIICLLQVLYWFNPLVYIAFNQMRLDRELACDASILTKLPKEFHADYGRTLLNFVSRLSRQPSLVFATNMGGSKPQITKRIKHIASYTADSVLLKAKSVCLFIIMGLLVFGTTSLVSVFASGADDNIFHFQADAQYTDLSAFFGGLEGSFVLYDLNNESFTIHNRNMSATRVSPTSTYKIISALIALEAGVLDINDTSRAWDGTAQPFEAWNQDHNLASAMRYSVNWYFQDMDAKVGIERLSAYLTRLSYGNHNLTGGLESFWNNSSLRISPLEQVKLLRDLHQNNTIFAPQHIDSLKNILRSSENDGAVLSGKTGTGAVEGRITSGWFIGYVEGNGNTFIFTTYIQGEDNAGGSTATRITMSILEYKGIF